MHARVGAMGRPVHSQLFTDVPLHVRGGPGREGRVFMSNENHVIQTRTPDRSRAMSKRSDLMHSVVTTDNTLVLNAANLLTESFQVPSSRGVRCRAVIPTSLQAQVSNNPAHALNTDNSFT